MNRHTLLKYCRQTALAMALSVSTYLMAEVGVDHVVAIVGDSAILQSELDQATAIIKQQSPNTNLSETELRKQVLEQLILRQAQAELLKRYNVEPSEQEVNQALLNYAKQQGINSLEQFQKTLDAQQPGLYNIYREQMRNEIAMNGIRQQMVLSRIKVTERDVTNFLQSPQGQALLGTQAHLFAVNISKKTPSITELDLKAAAQKIRSELSIDKSPNVNVLDKKYNSSTVKVESQDLGYVNLADLPADLVAHVSNLEIGQTTEQIQSQNGSIYVVKLIDRKKSDKKNLVTQYNTQHILIQPSEVVSAKDAEQKANQIYQRLKQGANFAEMAATYSNDAGTARDGGSLGWVVSGVMVPEFEKVMKETPAGQISRPFQTQFGWHILKVNQIRQEDMTTEYQRRMARQILMENQYDTELEGWLRELRANTYIDIKDPALKD